MLDDETLLSRSEGHLSSKVGDEAMVLSADGVYFGLEGVGGAIWDWLAEPVAFGTLVQRIVTEFQVDADTARRDAAGFVEDLIGHGLARLR